MAQQFMQSMVQKLPSACVLDIVAPTFAGVATVTPQANGSLLVAWLAASDISLPLTYEIYCLPGSVSAGVLFSSSPALASQNLDEYLFRDSADALLLAGTYTVGVRVRDAVGNLDSNTALSVVVSTGVLTDSLATIAASLNSTQLALTQDVSDLDAIEAALALDAASIDASATSLAASASTFSNAVAGLPDQTVAYGVVEAETVEGIVSDADALTLALSGNGGGGTGSEQVYYWTITSGEALAKSLTLPVLPADGDEVKVDWINVGPQAYGTDFTVTGTTLSWSGLGMDTEGLAAGDKLRIFYNA